MSTLAEIETAVDRLSYPEQEILLEHLAHKLAVCRPVAEVLGTQGERCSQTPVSPVEPRLRNRSVQEILDQIRAEDC